MGTENPATERDGPAPATWLTDELGRARMLDMSPRVRTLRNLTFVLQEGVLIACAPWLGWWTPFPLLFVGAGFMACERGMNRSQRPEFFYTAAWLCALSAVAVAAALTGGPRSPALCWMALAVSSLPGRFTTRGIVAGVSLALALILGISFGVDAYAVVHAPSLVLFQLMLVVGVALFGWAHMHSEVAQRAEAVMDPLTQMLNRKALVSRAQELAQQAALTGRPVAVVLGDLDHFKAINDAAGHQVGDKVLREVAERWRQTLRAYEMAYRLGGEEFLVLLPGNGRDEAVEVAERLRHAVCATPIAGHRVTMSFGVAASQNGEPFDFDVLYARADAALYESKRLGRDRVCSDPTGPLPAPRELAA